MSKVTITIDDSNPALVAAFGSNSLNTIADQFGYMDMVEKTEEELPTKIEVEHQADDGETFTTMEYPEGTEMFKANPVSRPEFVAQVILKTRIIPALLEKLEKTKRSQAIQAVDDEINTAKAMLISVAEVTVE